MSSAPNKGKNRYRFLHYLLYLIPVFLIIFGYFAISYATGEPSPFTIVTGTSMQPTILAGSIAMIEKVPFDQLKIGEVIVFSPPLASQGNCDSGPGPSLTQEANGAPCFVIHRIVQIKNSSTGERMIRTKGDNNPGSISGIDYWITQNMYVGMVILQLPIAGYVTQEPYNEYLGAVLLVLFVVELLWERKSSTPAPTQTKAVESTVRS
jgi:signal peptidase I